MSDGRESASSLDPAGEPVIERLASGLYIVATPIGNMRDITLRALDVLRGADWVLAEDTRVTRKLFQRYGLHKKLDRYDEHNARTMQHRVVEALKSGKAVALVSDAGTPLISDPGQKLVDAAIQAHVPVIPIPGASALLAGLVVSGLPTAHVLFLGFLPNRQANRRRMLEKFKNVDAAVVIFEAPQRLAATLADLSGVMGARGAAVARELTKRFEDVRRGRLDELAASYATEEQPKGEIVIVIGPPEASSEATIDLDHALRTALRDASLREAVEAVVEATGLPRRAVYTRALELKGGT